MILPLNIRRKAIELFPVDIEKRKAFLMGAAFTLGKDLKDFDESVSSIVNDDSYPLQEALSVWLTYKAEKNQKYKPSGLKMVKKKLLEMSGGDKAKAMAIVEQSMANNYSGLFPVREDYKQKQEQYEQQRNINKLGAIFK